MGFHGFPFLTRILGDSISALGPFTASYGGTGGTGGPGVGVIAPAPDPERGLPEDLTFDVGTTADQTGFSLVGTDVTTRIPQIPRDLEPSLSDLVEREHDLYGLPETFEISSARGTRDGIQLRLAGSGVELTR